MQSLISIAIAPIIVLLLYIYIKDKYEKEPKILILKCFLMGVLSCLPIVYIEGFLNNFNKYIELYFYRAVYTSFVVASFTEEVFKFLIFILLILKIKKNNIYFNEPFDALVYSVSISLGFASIENILYVLSPSMGGVSTGILRSIFSVPAHAIFGVYMGKYLGYYKFSKKKILDKKIYMIKALLIGITVHGIYDLLLFSDIKYIQVLFIIYYIYILTGAKKILKQFIIVSPFKNKNKK